MENDVNSLIKQAQKALKPENQSPFSVASALQLAEQLERESKFTFARRLRQKVYDLDPSNLKNIRKLAVATYKDDDLPNDLKFDAAARLLKKHFGQTAKDIRQWEAAGILGSICKKEWRLDNQIKHLYDSLEYYRQGFDLWSDARKAIAPDAEQKENLNDNGYCGLNYAFVLELLAKQLFKSGVSDELSKNAADDFKKQANKIREALLQFCENTHKESIAEQERFWFQVTYAETLLGLGRLKEATEQIMLAGTGAEWMRHSAWIQMLDLAQLRFGNWNNPNSALSAQTKGELRTFFTILLGEEPYISPSGKVGLALSGGGFRASIFHIGVLARLAEADLLKDIEVISCVSGGSIIGAYYYLLLKRLYETKTDAEITQQDYLGLVRKIETDFIQGVETNMRLRVFSNLWENIRIGYEHSYTRTSRLAELYESVLYRPLLKKEKDPIYMSDLLITPLGFNGPQHFNIRRDNIKRRNKVPMLILNATSLNTGHNWQFTASWMGEPLAYLNNELDARPAYRRMYYDEAPKKFQKLKLATAVSASSCVPGLFAPVRMDGLYENGRTLELIDGGVFDNQGVTALLAEECNSLIISDACGQMVAENQPGSSAFSVIGRTNDILQERLRENVFNELKAKHASGLVHGYALMHLTKGLPSEVVDWKDCTDKYDFQLGERAIKNQLTPYQIHIEVQKALAKVRTDLDAFHKTESYGLMFAGYKMTEWELNQGSASLYQKAQNGIQETWAFNQISAAHTHTPQELAMALDASDARFGKLLKLSAPFKYGAALVGLALMIGLSYWATDYAPIAWLKSVSWQAYAIFLLFVALSIDWWMRKQQSVLDFVGRIGIGIPVLGLLLFPVFWLALKGFNWMYIAAGKVKVKSIK